MAVHSCAQPLGLRPASQCPVLASLCENAFVDMILSHGSGEANLIKLLIESMDVANLAWPRLELRNMRILRPALLVAFAVSAFATSALADDEASNVTHVVAGPYGRCYAKSIPDHVYDPEGEPRQQGRTMVYRVSSSEDVLVQTFNWFSQRLFVSCGPADNIVVVRLGPWHRGHNPHADHLAIAFYQGGNMLKRYSTLDIAGDEKSQSGSLSTYRNVSASESHYTVFSSTPEMVKITTARGAIFEDSWVIRARTVDGRMLTFDMETGELR